MIARTKSSKSNSLNYPKILYLLTIDPLIGTTSSATFVRPSRTRRSQFIKNNTSQKMKKSSIPKIWSHKELIESILTKTRRMNGLRSKK